MNTELTDPELMETELLILRNIHGQDSERLWSHQVTHSKIFERAFLGSVVKKPTADADEAMIPEGRPPEEGNSNPLQYSCLENTIDRGAWWASVHGVTKELNTT